VNALPFHAAAFADMHLSGFGLDDFICIGLIAILLVVATFVVRGGEKAQDEDSTQIESPRSAEK
jgi:hypothetical protein